MIQISTPRHRTFCELMAQKLFSRNVGDQPLTILSEFALDDVFEVRRDRQTECRHRAIRLSCDHIHNSVSSRAGDVPAAAKGHGF
jgi:hypothetical protein